MPEVLGDLPPLVLRIYAVLFGLVWGSFLNVVIYRVPREMSVVRPASHCPGCGQPIHLRDNVPLFGYLLLRGRARCCGAKLSPRYPLVEAIGGLISLAILEAIIFPMGDGASLARAGATYCADLALALGLVAAAFIDLEHMILPDAITLGGAALGFATSSLRGRSFLESAIGAAAGFVIVWLPFVVIYPRLRGVAGMGLGDAKLLALAGAWFGWDGALFVIGLGAVQGLAAAVALLLSGRSIEDPEAVKREREEILKELSEMSPEERAEAEKELLDDPIMNEAAPGVLMARMAFGPFLVLGTLEVLLGARPIVVGWIDRFVGFVFRAVGVGA